MLSSSLLLVASSLALGQAQPQHGQAWMDFFVGKWVHTHKDGTQTESEWKRAPSGKSLVVLNERVTAIMGLESAHKRLVVTNYGADGSYYRAEMTEFGQDFVKGRSTTKDGQHTFMIRKTGENTFEFFLDDSEEPLLKGKRKE